MNKHYDDHKIASDFRRLRQVEAGLTPNFSSLLKGAGSSKPRLSLQPVAGFAVVVLTLSIFAAILLRPDNKGGATDALDNPLYTADSLQLGSDEEMPTDFLLETPWPQLASLGDEIQLPDLPYELLEEPSDEP